MHCCYSSAGHFWWSKRYCVVRLSSSMWTGYKFCVPVPSMAQNSWSCCPNWRRQEPVSDMTRMVSLVLLDQHGETWDGIFFCRNDMFLWSQPPIRIRFFIHDATENNYFTPSPKPKRWWVEAHVNTEMFKQAWAQNIRNHESGDCSQQSFCRNKALYCTDK